MLYMMINTQTFFYFQTLIILSSIAFMFKFSMPAISILIIISLAFLGWRKITLKQWIILVIAVIAVLLISFFIPENWNFKQLNDH